MPSQQHTRRNYHFVAEGDGSRDLSVDVVAAANGSALNSVGEHEGDSGAGGNRLGDLIRARRGLGAGSAGPAASEVALIKGWSCAMPVTAKRSAVDCSEDSPCIYPGQSQKIGRNE